MFGGRLESAGMGSCSSPPRRDARTGKDEPGRKAVGPLSETSTPESDGPGSGRTADRVAAPPDPASPLSEPKPSNEEQAHHQRRIRRRFSLAQLIVERRQAGISFTVGLIVLLLIQMPVFERSFIGAPDRQMMEIAYKLRADLVRGTADPVLFMDIDDRTISQLRPNPGTFQPPLATAPRGLIADLLDFMRTAPPAQSPRAVILDVDIAEPASDGAEGVARLHTALAAWGASKTTAPLLISRESFPAAAIGLDSPSRVLPDTPYDDVVQPAPNIFWVTPSVVGDQNGEIRELMPFECVLTSSGMKPLYSAALVAYQFIERDPGVLARAASRHWLLDGTTYCQTTPNVPLRHGERIDYHISLDLGFLTRTWANLDPRWPGFKTCSDADSSVFRRLSAILIDDAFRARSDIDYGLLCQHVVIIGGTNASGADFVQTPLNEMNGSAVLANAVRGLQLTHGGLRSIPVVLQVVLLLLATLAMSGTALATLRARRRSRRLRRNKHKQKLSHRFQIILLSPIVMNGIIALVAHGVGIGLLLVSLNFGLWGFVSAPVFAAAITQTVQEVFNG